MSINITKVKYYPELAEVAELADKIWHEFFVSILSGGQIDYMVEKFQSLNAMTEQIENQRYSYFAVRVRAWRSACSTTIPPQWSS